MAGVLASLAGVLLLVSACSRPAAPNAVDAAVVTEDATADATVVDTTPDAFVPLAITAVSPAIGSVAGGTELVVEGHGFSSLTRVRLGPFECPIAALDSSERIRCNTTSTNFREGMQDVIVADTSQQAMLAGAFTYECPWTTSSGRRSCGAVPPSVTQPQTVSAWLTQFDAGHGFVANVDGAGASLLADTSDRVLGTQSAWIQTDGAGTPRTLSKIGMTPIDFTDQDLKIWVKIDNVAQLTTLDVSLGDNHLANAFRFRLRSTQGQQWMTEGDWVSFAIPWTASNYSLVGSPNRAAITDVMIRAVDDATGSPVRVHLNGLALVAQPITRFPKGVISFTFDDNFATMVDPASTLLAQHNFPATAYVIVDMLGSSNRATLAQLHGLAGSGWDISAHAYKDSRHGARYTTLTAAEVEDDMVDSRAWLITNGFRGYNHCAYPGGAFRSASSADVLALAGRYFTSCRTIYQRQHETSPVSDARKLRVLYVTNTVTLESVKRAVDEAQTSREWLIMVFHDVVATPAVSTQWGTADFSELVDYVAASGVPVRTVDAVLLP